MLVLYDAIRPSVAAQLLSGRWSYMDTEIVPGGVAVLDAVRFAPSADLSAPCALMRNSFDHQVVSRRAGGACGGGACGGEVDAE